MKILLSLSIAFVAVSASASSISGTVVIKKRNGDRLGDASSVVVFLDGYKAPASAVPRHSAVLLQENKMFVPPVLPIMAGMEVEMPNEDAIFHNAFSLSKTKPFDLGLYKKGQKKSVLFDLPGLVKVYCNIHEKMVAYILVLENPYYAVTDRDGNFKLDDVPDGQYDLSAWYRYSDIFKQPIEVRGGKPLRVGFELTKGKEVVIELFEKDKEEGHLNKWGKHYKDKY
jgi:plastocyanin